jgi:hypothetical protein
MPPPRRSRHSARLWATWIEGNSSATKVKTLSAVVHADASILSSPFAGQITGADGIRREAARFWSMMVPGLLVLLDQLQCMEVLGLIAEG